MLLEVEKSSYCAEPRRSERSEAEIDNWAKNKNLILLSSKTTTDSIIIISLLLQ